MSPEAENDLERFAGLFKFNVDQIRDEHGRFTSEGMASMTGSEVNHHLDRLQREDHALGQQMIAAGRGNERPSEYLEKPDPLSSKLRQNYHDQSSLRNEVARRAGPGMSRVPKGYRFR